MQGQSRANGARESGAVGCSDSFGSGGLWMLCMSVFVRLLPSAILKGIGLLNIFELYIINRSVMICAGSAATACYRLLHWGGACEGEGCR